MSLQNLKDVLADLIPKEQNRIKNFKQQYGKTNIGQITVDMVSHFSVGSMCNRLRPKCVGSDKIRHNIVPPPGLRRHEGHERFGVRDLSVGS